MMKAAVILVGSLLVLGACASSAPPRIIYDKPGVSDADRKRDETQCTTASVGTSRPDVSLGMIRIDREAFEACMKARGYTPRPSSS
jgi:hypothetical protein